MSVNTAPPSEGFRLSQLIYDTRYRSTTIQIVALFAFMFAVGWLVNNAITNLELLGRPFSFNFLWNTAGYDVNQMLLEYDSQSTHGRAAILGLLNTLILAFVGCITATVIGVLAGVLRLSKNWIVARLMTVYIEAFRNVPVLVWILIVTAVVNESMPEPKEFKRLGHGLMVSEASEINNHKGLAGSTICMMGNPAAEKNVKELYLDAETRETNVTLKIFDTEDAARDAYLGGECQGYSAQRLVLSDVDAEGHKMLRNIIYKRSVVMTNGGFYFPAPEFSRSLGDINVGGLFNISLDFIAILAVLAGSIFVSGRIGRWADAKQAATGDRPKVGLLRWGVVLVPIIVLLVALGFYGEPASHGNFRFEGGTLVRDSFIGLWVALSLYTGAFIAENVRAGIQAISKGQTEAAFALGLRPGRTMSLVILPQALRVIIPPMISQYLNLTKNSSLAIAVGYMDATGTLGGITLNQTGREMETLLLLMGFYLVISLTISFFMNIYNERVKLRER